MSNKQQIQNLLDESEKFAEANEELLNAKADVTIKTLGMLLKELNTGIKELFEGLASTEYFDNKLGEKLQGTIKDAITTFTQVKHEINFAPNINVDIKPLQGVASNILEQNKLIYNLIEKIGNNNNGKTDELYRLVLLMVDKNNNFLDKINQMDYTPQLVAINESLNKKEATQWDIEVTKRDQVRGYLEKAVIKANNG